MLNKEEIREKALSIGFSSCGFTTPAQPIHYAIFENWIKKGFHANMVYLERQPGLSARKDPHRLLSNCLSIIVLTYPYTHKDASDNPLIGNIASYVQTQDYHVFLPGLINELYKYIQGSLDQPVQYDIFTDSSPILERELAWSAGLGWIGKNGSLISRSGGSFTFIAELFLDIRLDPDKPDSHDYCGNCTRCLDACPTHCIQPDRTIDSNLCLAYHTIENKGSIPTSLRPALANRIFGCDTCLTVCPWNKKNNPAFTHYEQPGNPGLLFEGLLNQEQFKNKYHNTPIMRAKYRGYKRNICIALGNSKSLEAIPVLSQILLDESEPLVRAHAAWALGSINHPLCRASLEKGLRIEKDLQVIDEIVAALKTID